MAKLLQVVNAHGHQVLVNTDLITRAALVPDKQDQNKTHVSLYFDGENRVLVVGDESRRVWDLLTGTKKKRAPKIY